MKLNQATGDLLDDTTLRGSALFQQSGFTGNREQQKQDEVLITTNRSGMHTSISHDKDTQYLELTVPLSNAPVLYYLEISTDGPLYLWQPACIRSRSSVAPQLAPEGAQRGLNRSSKKH